MMPEPDRKDSKTEPISTISTPSNSTSTTLLFEVELSRTPSRRRSVPKKVENAVYGYIRAVRALGHTYVNSLEVARALSLPVTDVEAAMQNLSDKGVRVSG